jgi:hypothetical protein
MKSIHTDAVASTGCKATVSTVQDPRATASIGAGWRSANPGSPNAVAAGCTCAVLDNGHGKGYMGREGVFCITASCPLHGVEFPAVQS